MTDAHWLVDPDADCFSIRGPDRKILCAELGLDFRSF
jgi:hypothetical protein